MRISAAFLLFFAIVVSASPGFSTPPDSEARIAIVTDFIATTCLDCHASDDPSGGLDLEALDVQTLTQVYSAAGVDDSETATVWEKIIRRLRSRQMPPPDAWQPDEAEYEQALHALVATLDDAAAKHPQPGRTESIRRLNRTEYRNAVRDLLSIDVDVNDLLPADEFGHGFDNVTVGEMSPVLLSRYLTAAEKVSRLAVGRYGRGPGGRTIRLPADRSQDSHVPGLPLGTRGGVVVDHVFPVSGQYEVQVRLMRDRDENIEGLSASHDIDVLVDRELVHRFSVSPPKNKDGWQRDDTLVDANLKKRFDVDAGPHRLGVTFTDPQNSLSEIKREPFHASFNRHRHPRKAPAIFEVSIVGPFDPKGPSDTPSRRRIFQVQPETPQQWNQAAEHNLRHLLRQAYRRPVTSDDLQVPMRFFKQAALADGFDAGMEAALTALLVNPHFLFRAETSPAGVQSGNVYRISDLELASRLSFFLWSSLPDDELLKLAEDNRLHEADELKGQVVRMLKDPKAKSLATNFAAQWLYLRNLDSFQPDRRLFPNFDDNLREALRQETELLFDRVRQEDQTVLRLIDSESTFLNERLAQHYGIEGVIGSHFRPVDVIETHRGGILRHGSILAVTSYATRTSPTVRGHWILENILGTPPPPPPPNVPSLEEKAVSEATTIRERLAEHRANPACASCHDLMDPVGFALEHFDAVGRWRWFDNGLPIDATGSLPDGNDIQGLGDLEAGILNRPEMFVGTLSEKLLTFALGRGITPSDGPAVRQIVRKAAEDDYHFSSLVLQIVQSAPFQMRVAE